MPSVWDQISEIWTGSANWTPEVLIWNVFFFPPILRPSPIRVSTSLLKSSPSVVCRGGETWPSFGVSLQSRLDQALHTYLSDNWFIGLSFVDKRLSATPTLRWTHFWSILWGVSWYRAKRGGLGGAFMSLYRCLIISKESKRKSSDWFAFISCDKQAPLFLILPDVFFPVSHAVESKGAVQWYTGSFTVSSFPNQSGYVLKLSIWEQLR